MQICLKRRVLVIACTLTLAAALTLWPAVPAQAAGATITVSGTQWGSAPVIWVPQKATSASTWPTYKTLA